MDDFKEIPEVIDALKDMGMDGYCQFYSYPDHDYTEKVADGLNIIKGHALDKPISKFSISGYPIWNGPEENYVSCFCSLTIKDSKIKIDQLSLSFKMPNINAPFHTIELFEPPLQELPTAKQLRDQLKAKLILPKKKQRIKR
ncbi:MAG: hypothetical protein P0Y49_09425 [Candidatus Pedobacter colombiensis]|uniref:Uncharacterized protein n=1 Tax=Candidatus Pedobacter colombiensis TaxID=3121371 RepID=A0AAJ6B8G6_9SPHI|nr:hypothetical protein [Pedobacter sp.]WEK21360.1 MAG: hypothetical protein P0Y49_09425 [Pedobacter sp.]